MLSSARLTLFARAALVGGALAMLAGCGLFDKNDASNNANKDAAQYRERPIEQIYADAWRAIAGHDVLDRLHGIDVPTTCIAGLRDESTPLPAMQATAHGIPGAELVEVDEPHMGFLEEPEEFSAVLRAHLDRVRS